jgi:hypothetical protein
MSLHIKLSRTAKALAVWARGLIPQGKLAAVICREVIFQLDTAHEDRLLSEDEHDLKKLLKSRILGLTAIERSRASQKSRATWIRQGDANTKYFHILANNCKKKNMMLSLTNGTELATTQSDKHKLVFKHFQKHISTCSQRRHRLNLEQLGRQPQQLQHLDAPFTEAEVATTIKAMPKEKAPGPYGFIGLFFKSCWSIIKSDIMQALNQFFSMNSQGLQFLNQALVVLIPKKPQAEKVTDFRPISLIHSFTKLISKILANRLSLELKNLISHNQNAFIKKRCLHDNFMFVCQMVKKLHKSKIPSLFIKLDISNAFDTVNWSYLLDIMVHLGFGLHWRNWILMLWASSSSSFLINGELGKKICHKRGVRQGDPYLPCFSSWLLSLYTRCFNMLKT